MGFRQFDPYILTLQEQANAVRSHEILGISKQLRQGRQGSGRNHVKTAGGQVFQAGILNGHGYPHPFGRQAQEGAFLGRRFMEGYGQAWQHRSQNQAGEAGSGSQIGQAARLRGDEGGELGTIPEMPSP